jgi:MoxR-like ATPase
MKINVPYPSHNEELEIVRRMGAQPPVATQVVTADEVAQMQAAARQVYVDPAVADYAVRLVMATRNPAEHGLSQLNGQIACGASPRASLGLIAAGRALALLRGQTYVTPQEVFDVGFEVLHHRLVLTYEALADGHDPSSIATTVLSSIYAPVVTPGQLASQAQAAVR